MIAITNGKIITPAQIIEGKTLLIDGDRISGFADAGADTGAEKVVDARGRCVMPGMIDVHSDKLEQYIQPRPTSQVDFEFALKICERDLLSAGITTMYHSISLFGDEFFGVSPLRTKESVQKMADLIAGVHLRDHLIRHRFHLRLEIDNPKAYDIAREMIDQGKAQQISFMDHTPGQGQYRTMAAYQETVSQYDGTHNGKAVRALSAEELREYHAKKPKLSPARLKELTRLAHAKGIPVASHDDDTPEKLWKNLGIGVDISEFPVNLETAKAAKKLGFYTVVGSANILRGGSHSGNLSAAEAVLADCADIICSDYYPAAILHSIFYMYEKHGVPLPRMVNMTTLNPARAMRTDKDYGSIETGKKADLLIVGLTDGCPVVTHVFVDGVLASRVEYRRERGMI
ncbi:MAG: alpha-D-ribose 1-methylphosphonate 5-triphosphate diphosphatase [Gracilibacteraceae bacterium]|nr:alpha-D-ribose 1-methylphosphonate 5-triphosphate diphosphatase [Gracilibacteraceae bacterium]